MWPSVWLGNGGGSICGGVAWLFNGGVVKYYLADGAVVK